ncbi:MAG TPA: J domain-containing protein, partial [bacterium]|nr:J domain-containing protein [bacterium]
MTALIHLLSERAQEDGTWTVSPEEVAGLLGIDQVRFWRAVHDVQERISVADAIDGWSQETVGELVTVLERLLGAGPEEEMTRAGLFLPSMLGIELIEELTFRARRMGAAHQLRTEELAAMLRHTGGVRAAIEIYLDEYADVDALVDGSAESFRVLRGFPPRGRETARLYLARMFARHILDRRGLLTGLIERLRLEAARLGYADPEDRARGESRAGTAHGSSRNGWARKVMGFDAAGLTAEALRLRYRQLMMRHHPDVDPGGLERCK